MKIYVVRHGDKETGDYYDGTLKHQDPPLSEAGYLRARKLAHHLSDVPFTRVIASEYLRAAQTACHIAEVKGIEVERDGRLNEIDSGVIEPMTGEEIGREFPEFWRDFQEAKKDVRFPEGETGEEVKARQEHLLADLLERDEDTLLVSHEGYMRLLMCHLLGMPVYHRRRFRVDPCGVMEVEYDAKALEWRVHRFNSPVCH